MGKDDEVSHDDALKDWLIERVAFYLDRPADSIDPTVELAEYGVDSVYALSIISDIEDRLQMEVDVEMMRQHRTIEALAGYLTTVIEKARDEQLTAGPP
jgi:acyl carrier protein